MKTMRKIFVLMMVVLLLFAGCSSSTKYPMTEQHEKFGRKALEIADAYLDFEISTDEAYQKINDLYDAKDSLPEGTGEQSTGNLLVETKVFFLDSALWAAKAKSSGFATFVSSDVLASRNELAELLGVKAR